MDDILPISQEVKNGHFWETLLVTRNNAGLKASSICHFLILIWIKIKINVHQRTNVRFDQIYVNWSKIKRKLV